jgi:hypothetical protein
MKVKDMMLEDKHHYKEKEEKRARRKAEKYSAG